MLLRAFAKINLDLRILGKREDGYHEVRTLLQTIDWCDEIHIDLAPAFSFAASSGPSDETNLVVRAVRQFERLSGREARVRVQLQKNVPAGAGLGGGSADAAMTFVALQALYSIAFDAETQQGALRELGSDVPFFVSGGLAMATGRGDVIEPLDDAANYWLVVVMPPVHVATVEAYSWLTLQGKTNTIEGFRADSAPGSKWGAPANDFETPVFARHPVLAGVKDELVRSGARRAALSGSGAALFGIFDSREGAQRAAKKLAGRYLVKFCRPLARPEYLSLRMEP